MLLKEVLLFCGFKLLPDFCKLPFSFPALSSVFKDLSDIWEMLCLFSPLSSFSNLTSECVCARVRRLLLLLATPPLALATSSELWNLPRPGAAVLSLENSAIFARTPDSFSSRVTVWKESCCLYQPWQYLVFTFLCVAAWARSWWRSRLEVELAEDFLLRNSAPDT